MDTNTLVVIGLLIVLFLIALWMQAQQHKSVVEALTGTLSDLQKNPVFVSNAEAVAKSVPQESFEQVYKLVDSLQALLGASAPVSLVLAQAESLAKTVDNNPSNDPTPDAAHGQG